MTVYWAVVWNAHCDSKSRLQARSREKLWSDIIEGQNRGLYGSVYETGEEQQPDWEKEEAAVREYERMRMTSCPMPPEEDLLLLAAAKRVDERNFDAIMAIDTSRGIWKRTRQLLHLIRADKYNKYLRQRTAAET